MMEKFSKNVLEAYRISVGRWFDCGMRGVSGGRTGGFEARNVIELKFAFQIEVYVVSKL